MRTSGVEIVGATRLEAFWKNHSQAKRPLQNWYRVAEKANWQSIVDVRVVYPHADFVNGDTIFNISGNKFRLVVVIAYAKGIIIIKEVLSHGQYTRRYCQ